MIKALAIKELRESAGLAALAGLGMVWAVIAMMGVNPFRAFSGYLAHDRTIPFVENNFTFWICLFTGGFAITLGLKQTAWEHGKDTFYFLLWRPVSRRVLLSTKIFVGLGLLLSLLAVSIVVYGWWASVPGHAMVPFEWSMTFDTWKLAVPLVLVYLGAFISGIRPGHWFGTRLMPLAGSILWAMLVYLAPYGWLYFPIAAIGYFCAIVAIFYFADTSDY